MTDQPYRTEGVDMSEVDALAQEIRRVDGAHKLGAGGLAGALMPFIEAVRAEERERYMRLWGAAVEHAEQMERERDNWRERYENRLVQSVLETEREVQEARDAEREKAAQIAERLVAGTDGNAIDRAWAGGAYAAARAIRAQGKEQGDE